MPSMDRWPRFYKPALRWIGRVERAIAVRDHPEHGAFAAIINAIQYQLEIGADPETTELLLKALARLACSRAIDPQAIGLDPDPAASLARFRPGQSATR